MTKRGTVWIAPDGWVPAGRMVDPDVADFWVSWQDEGLLEDGIVRGADAAIGWGRRRSAVVLIRLGQGQGSYFSAGVERPPVLEDDPESPLPDWPPVSPPAEGWWSPPQVPTLDEVASVSRRSEAGEIDRQSAVDWAQELLLAHRDLDARLIRALWELRGLDEPLTG